jgi:hypothetical protein
MLNRFSMCACTWRAEPEIEPPAGVRLQVPAQVRDRHRVARERDGDAGSDLEPRRVFGGQQHRQEWIVVDLAGPASVVAASLERADHPWDTGEFARDAPVDPEADGSVSRHAPTPGT